MLKSCEAKKCIFSTNELEQYKKEASETLSKNEDEFQCLFIKSFLDYFLERLIQSGQIIIKDEERIKQNE